jgi:hypothetical protein
MQPARLSRLFALSVLPLAVALSGCAQSEADKAVAETVDAVKSCSEYAYMRAHANCTRFVEQARNPESAFGQSSDKVVRGLQARWQDKCAAQKGDIASLEMKTTIALTRSGAVRGSEASTKICAAQVKQELAAYPALSADADDKAVTK